ncbi:MAG TPA: LacI family DNA-binding transcriptional regulator [Solirubrobacter sp.]|nr:LacI family DNA-binding transcriptional regulator [Solirubrobacter sp.]
MPSTPNRSGRRVTISDVAAAAGVSRTTASDALNGKGRVEAATRERVAQTAVRLGYQTNRTARSLRSGRSGILALLVPVVGTGDQGDETVGLDYYMHLASSITAAAFQHDHAVILVPPLGSIRDLRAFPVDGAIVADPVDGDPRVQMLDGLGVPVVTVERDLQRRDPWYVASDNAGNARLVLDHLAGAGARRIALMVPEVTWAWRMETVTAYRAWAAERDMAARVVSVPPLGLESNSYVAAYELLAGAERPDAIFALAERFSTGVLRAAAERGLGVPEDLLVVAGVDSHQARAGDPSVTALDLDPQAQAAAAVAMLIARLEGAAVEAPQYTVATLHVRASTRR